MISKNPEQKIQELPTKTGCPKSRLPAIQNSWLLPTERKPKKNYLLGLKKDIENETGIPISLDIHTGIETKKLLAKCKDEMSKSRQFYSQCWIILDRDQVTNFDSLIAAIEAAPRVHAAWSNPCLEYWFLCYLGLSGNCNTSQLCCRSFEREYKKLTGEEYDKSEKKTRNIYQILTKDPANEAKAVHTAKTRHQQHLESGIRAPSKMVPCTTMYELIESFRNRKKNKRKRSLSVMCESSARLKALCNAFAPSGCENEVAAVIAREYPLPFTRDPIGNLYFCPDGKTPADTYSVLLDAHADEVGFMVQAIEENGLLRFHPLGGWNAQAACGQPVVIQTDEGRKIHGVISAPAVHFQKENRPLSFEDLRMDAGCTSRQEAANLGIQPGDFAVPDQLCTIDEERGLVFSKALDDRIGLCAMLEALEQLSQSPIASQIEGIASVQEEVGERGMQAAIAGLHAHYAIVLEGAPADDPFMPEGLAQTALGKGPMVRAKDRSMITDPAFMKLVRQTAKECSIPLQIAVRDGGGTNAGILHTHNIPSIVIGIPTRYAHAARSIASLEDFENAVRLCVALAEKLCLQSSE